MKDQRDDKGKRFTYITKKMPRMAGVSLAWKQLGVGRWLICHGKMARF